MEIDIKGYKVQIDEEDYGRVTSLKWLAQESHGNIYFFHGFYYDKKKKYNMPLHRFLLGMIRGNGLLVDHISGDTLDNRKCNLRICTSAENSQNSKKTIKNTSGYKGVDFDKNIQKYHARIGVNRKRINLGYFSTPEEAYAAYCEASKKYHGEYGRVK